VIVAGKDERKADNAALGLAEVGELGHAADVHAGSGPELHGFDHLPRLTEAAVWKDLDVECRRFRVHIVGEDPRKHLVLGADNIVCTGVIDAYHLLVGSKRAGRSKWQRYDGEQPDDEGNGLRSKASVHLFRSL